MFVMFIGQKNLKMKSFTGQFWSNKPSKVENGLYLAFCDVAMVTYFVSIAT